MTRRIFYTFALLNQQMVTIQESKYKNFLLNPKTWIATAICILTIFTFRYSLNNSFTNWDDDYYVINNKLIRDLNVSNLGHIFSKDGTNNYYHPLCILSLAINYHFSQLRPEGYYLTNILIHTANTLLVFLLVIGLCARMKLSKSNSLFMAAFSSAWFGIHPMHVESVSWISERKDVLYAFFYLLGLLSYLQFLDEYRKKALSPFRFFMCKWYWITFLLYVLSCLSKPMGVVFPASLFLIDILLNDKVYKKFKDRVKFLLNELYKLSPFLIASLILGGLAIYMPKLAGSIAPFNTLTIGERIMYASYGFVMYITKLFNPTHLSTFYPYPYRYIDGSLPWIYYASPLIAVLILGLPLYFAYRYNKTYFKVLLFGYGFFIVNIIFVLQFISCGAAIMADRYSYVSYFGLLFMLTYFIAKIMDKFPAYKITFIVVLSVLTLGLSYMCYGRTKAWHNAETVLKDATNKYPYQALLSYKWLGNYYLDSNKLQQADSCYRLLVKLHSADAKVFDNLGNVYRLEGDLSKAKMCFDTSLQMGGNIYRTLLDRSVCVAMMGDSSQALLDYENAYHVDVDPVKYPSEVRPGQFSMAEARYNTLPYFYFYRGVRYFQQGNMPGAESDFKNTLAFNNPGFSVQSAYNLSVVCDSLGNDSDAVKYAIYAQQNGYRMDPDYINKLRRKKR